GFLQIDSIFLSSSNRLQTITAAATTGIPAAQQGTEAAAALVTQM
ncbi:hypothetical protein M8C21_031393, partial [Ambrosia artemisiifolia]